MLDKIKIAKINQAILILFILIFSMVGCFFLKSSASVMAPLVFAIMISFMLFPIMQFLEEKCRMPRTLAVVLIMSLMAVFIYFITVIIQSSFTVFLSDYPKYLNKFRDIYYDFSNKIMVLFNLDVAPDFLKGYDWSSMVQNYVMSLSGSFTKIIGYTVLIFIFMFFLFLEYPYIAGKINSAFSIKASKKFMIISARILQLVGKYFFIKSIISFLTGLEVWIILKLTGVDFPLIWGCIAFFLNFVPTIGSTLVVVLISIQGVVQFYPDPVLPTVIFLLNLGIQQLMGNFIEPRIQGTNLNLSPVLILVTLAFWSWIWGPLGAILAVPITVMFRVAFSYFDSTRFLSIMMSTGYSQKEHK